MTPDLIEKLEYLELKFRRQYDNFNANTVLQAQETILELRRKIEESYSFIEDVSNIRYNSTHADLKNQVFALRKRAKEITDPWDLT